MNVFSVHEFIELAIQTEKLGAKFYTHMAKKFKDNDEFSNLFTEFAIQEVAHEKTFSSIMENADASYQVPDNWGEVSKYMRAIVESEFFLGSDKFLLSGYEHLETTEDVFNYAISFEKMTLLYYLQLQDIVGDNESVNDAVSEIISEEKRHVVLLADRKNQLTS